MGAHVGMRAGLQAVGVRLVLDQYAGEEDYGTTLSSLASAIRMLLLGRTDSRRSALLTRPERACAGPIARLTTGPMIFVFMMVIAQCARAEDTCIDPSTLAATTVSVTRYFTADEKPQPSLEGYRATAWFYGSTRYLISIAHFVDDAPALPRGEWRKVDVQQRDVTVQVNARLLAVVRALPEGFAIFELRDPFPNAHTLKLREKPLSRNEPVRSIAYPGGLRLAKGRFAEIAGSSDIPGDHPFAKVRPGSGLFEMWDIEERNNDRYVLDHGASGAPIIDCEGNVAAVASSIVTQGSLYFAGREFTLTTPWGMANNTAALIQPLFDIALPQ
jgi:Trypsin-like peptidase domain